GKHGGRGGQAVFEGIESRPVLPLEGPRTGALLGIAAVDLRPAGNELGFAVSGGLGHSGHDPGAKVALLAGVTPGTGRPPVPRSQLFSKQGYRSFEDARNRKVAFFFADYPVYLATRGADGLWVGSRKTRIPLDLDRRKWIRRTGRDKRREKGEVG